MPEESEDIEQQEIEAMKAADDFAGLGRKIQQLLQLPQSLCRTRGNCCRVATFKGSLTYQDIVELAASDDQDAANAQEFLTLFLPYETREEVMAIAPVFVERVSRKNREAAFFRCRFLGEAGKCLIHEDRPTGCRVYPFPHENTIYHPGCGFERKGQENHQKIEDIRRFFEKKLQELNAQAGLSQEQPLEEAEEAPCENILS